MIAKIEAAAPSVDRAIGSVERVDDCLVIRLACFGRYANVPRDRVKQLAGSLIDAAMPPKAAVAPPDYVTAAAGAEPSTGAQR